jgi:hypothetical protein
MVPLGPGQSAARRKLRCGVEIGASTQHRTAVSVRTLKIKSNDAVDWFGTAGMVLAYREHESALRMDPNVTESEPTPSGDRPRLAIVVDHVQTPVTVLRIDHCAACDVIFAAAILVHSGAYVGRCRGDLYRVAAGNVPAPQAGPASLVSPDLQPVDVSAIDLDRGESCWTDQLVN